ncbi:hypothetical protein ACAW74_05105 [Fibrella sp. WM1]|uniref:hypothetical protein n=1 Tax=Fibrella musci TaxID=3242485 RepID=UPI00352166E8
MIKTCVPVRDRHVRQFICARFGNNTTTVELSRKSMLGVLAELSCEKVGYRHVIPSCAVDQATSVILMYPDSLKNHFIHPNKLQLLEKMFNYMFSQMFLEACEVSLMLGMSDYDAVNLFMERYGITEDMVASDTLRKKWRDHQRYMKRKVTSMMQQSLN